MNTRFELLPWRECDVDGESSVPFSHTEPYRRMQEHYFGLSSGSLRLSNGAKSTYIPVFWDKKTAFIAHRTYIAIPEWCGDLDWSEFCARVRAKTETDTVTADVSWPYSGTIQKPFRQIPISIFWLNIASRTEAQVFAACNERTRNKIRKISHNGFTAVRYQGRYVDGYYALYTRRMKEFGTPPKAEEYFNVLLSSLGKSLESIGLYSADGRLAGFQILAHAHGTTTMMFSLAEREYWDRLANHQLYWEMVRAALSAGSQRVDLGGSDDKLGSSTAGLKLGFGADVVPLFRASGGSLRGQFELWGKRKRYNLQLRWNKLWNR